MRFRTVNGSGSLTNCISALIKPIPSQNDVLILCVHDVKFQSTECQMSLRDRCKINYNLTGMQEKISDNGKFSVNLREILKQTGWKQVDLAKAIGVSPVTVNRWLKRSNGIAKEYLEAISTAIGVDVMKLTGCEILREQLTDNSETDKDPSYEEWRNRALIAEAKLKHLQEACSALGHHVSALGCTVQSFSKIISE